MPKLPPTALALLLAAAPAGPDRAAPPDASADVLVRLRNGRTLRGTVLEQDARTLRFRTASGILTELRPDDILSVGPAGPDAPSPRPATGPAPSPPGPAARKHSDDCPADCPLCERLFRHSLDSLCADVLARPAEAPIPVRLGPWPALQSPACSVLGLVLLGEGDANRPGLHQRTLLRLTRYVAAWAERDHPALAGHRTWTVAFATLFLAHLHQAAPSETLRRKLQRTARLLGSARLGPAGWGHRFQQSGYGPFIAVTVWAAVALDAARRQGAAVDEKALDAAFAALRRSVGPAGGASYYADKPTVAGVGRTGGVAWALRFDDEPASTKAADRAAGFLLRHLPQAPHGHASGLMAFAWAALGAASAGPDAHRRFWLVHRRTLLDARSRTGRFLVQPWKDLGFSLFDDSRPPVESRGTTWPDRMYGDGWATVWMLLAWQVGRGRSVLLPPAHRPP